MFEKFCGDAVSDHLWTELKKEALAGIWKKYFNFSVLLLLGF